MRAVRLAACTAVAFGVLAVASDATTTDKPIKGSKMIDGPGGTKLLKAPAKFACADLVIGAKFLKSPSKGGAYSVEAVRIENGETHGSIPRVLHPNGHQWVYDTVRVGCGHTYTERYVVKLGNKAPRPVKRVEFTFTVAKAQ